MRSGNRKNRVEVRPSTSYVEGKQRETAMLSRDYQLVERVIHYLGDVYLERPDLKEISRRAGLSEFHFQRLFTRWAGVSPKKFLQYLTKEHARRLLDHSHDVLSVSFDSGLSGPGRLHDLFVNFEAMTPGDYKTGGAGLTIRYGFHPSPFGECFIATTDRGICALHFVATSRSAVLNECRSRWRHAEFVEDTKQAASTVRRIFDHTGKIHLDVRGTNFQVKVWEALIRIPEGAVATYSDIARAIGRPGASRAVGTAIGSNPVAYLIPCHRVIRGLGVFGNYRWGEDRKKAILGWEFARRDAGVAAAAG